jgi:hypothetical protein
MPNIAPDCLALNVCVRFTTTRELRIDLFALVQTHLSTSVTLAIGEGSGCGLVEETSKPQRVRLRASNQHHGRGMGGQLVAPHAKRTAKPSLIKVDPTSTAWTRSVPQRRPKLQMSVPSVPGAHEHATCLKSDRPSLTSSRSRCFAASLSCRSASHLARLPVSGALKPTRRTFSLPS